MTLARSQALFLVSLWTTFIVSLWLRQTFPIFAIGPSGHDDLLFVHLAAYLGNGQWLGPYDNLTMAKGAAYSFFMVANHLTGLPLKITEHVVYLAVSLYFALTMGTLFRSRWAAFLSFAVLAFNPTGWDPGVGGRVVREGLYLSLSLLLLTTAIQSFVLDRSAELAADMRAKLPVLVGLGMTAGIYWLTREEGIWLAPSLLILAAYWVVRRRAAPGAHTRRRYYGRMLVFLAIPAVACALVVGAMNSGNYFKYGVFRNNDFRSADFQSAYGALSRIQHAQWAPYIVFPKDARKKAYAVSAAARELMPFFEGPGGENWRKAGCEQTGRSPCPEILSGWFMWALRDAVAAAGHYRSALEARAYHRRLAREINAACDRGEIPCGPRHDSLVPPWRPQYLGDTLNSIRAVFGTLISLGGAPVRIQPSFGSDHQLALFSLVTNGPLVTSDGTCGGGVSEQGHYCSPRDRIRLGLATKIAQFQAAMTAVAVPAAILAWCALAVIAMVRRRWHPGQIVVAALIAAVAMRVLLLGFLEATSIPSNNMLYLSPVVPMALVLGPCVLFLAIAGMRRKET